MPRKKLGKTSTVFFKTPVLFKSLLVLAATLLMLGGLTACHMVVGGMLSPKGPIAEEERKLFFDTLALMLIVVLPVIIMSFTFVFHYRASHPTQEYKPNLGHNFFLEAFWWGIPCVIIVVLAILTWIKTHELDPYRRIPGYKDSPLLIQAIALPWKWLFIYPEQGIATINYLEIPVGRQIEFWTTADNVPMSALFIPELGSQIYSMAGMRTRLHLVATQPGKFVGMDTLFNGDGFSDMRFTVRAVTPLQMQQWFKEMKTKSIALTDDVYNQLLKPSINDVPKFFGGVPNNFFENVINLYINSSGTMHPRANQANYSKKD